MHTYDSVASACSPMNAASGPVAAAAGGHFGASVAPPKARKEYVIQKHREAWTDEEHLAFEGALRTEGRNWKRIAELIPSKSVIQIRSHAQKHFLKLDKAGQHAEIPPARAKKRAMHPYPKSRTGPNKTSSYSWNKAQEERMSKEGAAGNTSSASSTSGPDTHHPRQAQSSEQDARMHDGYTHAGAHAQLVHMQQMPPTASAAAAAAAAAAYQHPAFFSKPFAHSPTNGLSHDGTGRSTPHMHPQLLHHQPHLPRPELPGLKFEEGEGEGDGDSRADEEEGGGVDTSFASSGLDESREDHSATDPSLSHSHSHSHDTTQDDAGDGGEGGPASLLTVLSSVSSLLPPASPFEKRRERQRLAKERRDRESKTLHLPPTGSPMPPTPAHFAHSPTAAHTPASTFYKPFHHSHHHNTHTTPFLSPRPNSVGPASSSSSSLLASSRSHHGGGGSSLQPSSIDGAYMLQLPTPQFLHVGLHSTGKLHADGADHHLAPNSGVHLHLHLHHHHHHSHNLDATSHRSIPGKLNFDEALEPMHHSSEDGMKPPHLHHLQQQQHQAEEGEAVLVKREPTADTPMGELDQELWERDVAGQSDRLSSVGVLSAAAASSSAGTTTAGASSVSSLVTSEQDRKRRSDVGAHRVSPMEDAHIDGVLRQTKRARRSNESVTPSLGFSSGQADSPFTWLDPDSASGASSAIASSKTPTEALSSGYPSSRPHSSAALMPSVANQDPPDDGAVHHMQEEDVVAFHEEHLRPDSATGGVGGGPVAGGSHSPIHSTSRSSPQPPQPQLDGVVGVGGGVDSSSSLADVRHRKTSSASAGSGSFSPVPFAEAHHAKDAADRTPLKPSSSFFSPLTPGPLGLNAMLASPFASRGGVESSMPTGGLGGMFSPPSGSHLAYALATPRDFYDHTTPDKRAQMHAAGGAYSPFFQHSPSQG